MTRFCTNCGYVGETKRVTKGSFLIEVLLWLVLFLPGFIYSIWRLASRYDACPMCGAANMVPLNSPSAKQLMQAQAMPSMPSADHNQTTGKHFKPMPPLPETKQPSQLTGESKDFEEFSTLPMHQMLDDDQVKSFRGAPLRVPLIYDHAGLRRALFVETANPIRIGTGSNCEIKINGPEVMELIATLRLGNHDDAILSISGVTDQSVNFPLMLDTCEGQLTFFRPQDCDLWAEEQTGSTEVTLNIIGLKRNALPLRLKTHEPILIGADRSCHILIDDNPVCAPVAVALWARSKGLVLIQILDNSAPVDWPGRGNKLEALLSFPITLSIAGKLIAIESDEKHVGALNSSTDIKPAELPKNSRSIKPSEMLPLSSKSWPAVIRDVSITGGIILASAISYNRFYALNDAHNQGAEQSRAITLKLRKGVEGIRENIVEYEREAKAIQQELDNRESASKMSAQSGIDKTPILQPVDKSVEQTPPLKKVQSKKVFQMGDAFKLGDFTYTIENVEELTRTITGEFVSEEALNFIYNQTKGIEQRILRDLNKSESRFLLVSYKIRNDGNNAVGVSVSDFVIRDKKGRNYTTSVDLTTELVVNHEADLLIKELQPGITKTIVQGFELPNDSFSGPLTLIVPIKEFFSNANVEVNLTTQTLTEQDLPKAPTAGPERVPEADAIKLKITKLEYSLAKINSQIEEEQKRWQDANAVINAITNNRTTPVLRNSPEHVRMYESQVIMKQVESGAQELKQQKAVLEATIKSLQE